MCIWQVEDGDVEVVHEAKANHHLFFYQQVFIKAIGVVVATIAHASAARGQGGSSNLQRFKAHNPPTFMGEGDLMVAAHWF